jgi:hypothetical protein
MSTAHFAGGGRLFFLPSVAKSIRESRSLRSLTNSKMHDSKRHCQTPEVESLTCYQTYRSTPGEAAKLKEHARLAGVSVSELTRRRVHGHAAPAAAAPEINMKAYAEYSRLGGNLNQIAHDMNSRRLAGIQDVLDHAQLRALVEKLLIANAELRADLIGASKK